MAQIRRYPVLRHFRGEPTYQTLLYRDGRLVRNGRGLSFWFRPLRTGIAEVPLDDRETPYLFHGRTADFQEATVQGVLTYRVVNPEVVADRIDFTVDTERGTYRLTPLEQLAGLLTQLAQEQALDYLARTPLRTALIEGVDELRTRIGAGLAADARLTGMGIEVVAARVVSVRPTADVERALQTPTLEALKQQADEATFQRRALAVEKERAIAENELQNQIELARREEQLIAQRGANDRQRAQEMAEAGRIGAESAAEQRRIAAKAEAVALGEIEDVRVDVEGQRLALMRDLPRDVLMGIAARELANKLERIEHLNITPELLGPLLGDLLRRHEGVEGS